MPKSQVLPVHKYRKLIKYKCQCSGLLEHQGNYFSQRYSRNLLSNLLILLVLFDFYTDKEPYDRKCITIHQNFTEISTVISLKSSTFISIGPKYKNFIELLIMHKYFRNFRDIQEKILLHLLSNISKNPI